MAKKIPSLDATSGYRDIVGLQIALLDFEPFAGRIWELRFNLTLYDAWYVACAEGLGVPLATLDARIGRAPGPACSFLSPGRAPESAGKSS